MAGASQSEFTQHTVAAGLLGWLVPGAGHFWLGYRGFAVLYFVAITLPFMTGMALGGVKMAFNVSENYWLILAELCVGSYSLIFYGVSQAVGAVTEANAARLLSSYPGSDVAQIYLAIAGLLNMLAVRDAMTRARARGLPVFHHELHEADHAAPASVSDGRAPGDPA